MMVQFLFFSMLNLGYREMSNCFLTHAVGCPQGDKLVDLKKKQKKPSQHYMYY